MLPRPVAVKPLCSGSSTHRIGSGPTSGTRGSNRPDTPAERRKPGSVSAGGASTVVVAALWTTSTLLFQDACGALFTATWKIRHDTEPADTEAVWSIRASPQLHVLAGTARRLRVKTCTALKATALSTSAVASSTAMSGRCKASSRIIPHRERPSVSTRRRRTRACRVITRRSILARRIRAQPGARERHRSFPVDVQAQSPRHLP